MEWYEIAVDGERTARFPTRALHAGSSHLRNQKHLQKRDVAAAGADEDYAASQELGGIIKRGAWGWLSSGNVLEVTALRTGQTIATYEFTEMRGYDNCCIRCVEELFPNNTETVLLAVCLECFRAAGGGCTFVAIYSIEHSQVLSCMELPLHITTSAFLSANCCRRSLLQNFDGCLAVGSEEGVILLLDLNINKIMSSCDERMSAPNGHLTDAITVCQIVDYNLPLAEIHRAFRQTRHDDVHFGLQVEVIETPCTVQCLLPIDLALGLAVGLEDGRLAFYDLAEMQIFHIAMPHPQQAMAPVVKLSFLEPLDDPRHCLYIWAMHENGENLHAALHTLIYEKRLAEKDGFCYFESFLTSTARLQLPLEITKSVAIGCQSISKIQNGSINDSMNATQADEDGYCLCALTWYSTLEEKNKLLIFDLNQWYKEEMPYNIVNQKCPSYLAGYVLSGRQCALSAYLNPSTIAHFNSLQRFEEHFYPNSLSFDCGLLLEDSTLGYTWIGAQNKIINVLRGSNSSIFLEPNMYFREILRARLLPQFSELNVDSTFSRLAIYETILSVALEHNCFSLLRDCAKCWADGSFMGSNFTATTGISLSTLTDWIWKRATDIKTRCNDLSKGLFDYAGYPLDQREQKELGYLTRQLKLLADLLSEVLSTGKRYIPDNVFLNLETQHKSMRMASEYQDVLLWLLNIGLLPELQQNRSSYSSYKLRSNGRGDANANITASNVQYPYDDLKNIYALRRAFFGRINENFISKKTGSCRLLFIDALIEHECKSDGLRECWLENGGNGLYPPPTIEAMLRVMLVPEVEFESKCAILLYFFLDLHMTIEEQAHKEVVESFVKFPSVFKLTAALIKTVQSLWNLDHGLFMPAVDEFISPFNNNQTYSQWMLELLIESLLTQNAADFALRILEARPTLISPILKLKTLLANDLLPEAFHFARTKQDESLLELFFKCCLCAGKYSVIRDLALSEREGQLVQRILRNSKTHGAENLHFVYLLQKSKYIEAVSYLDELSRSKNLRANYGHESSVVDSYDTPNLVLSAFNTTMAPVTQGLTDVYFRIKNKIKKKEADNRSPVPLSCQLIKQNANNLLGGIYHSSALSAHFATYYWGEIDDERRRHAAPASALLSANNAPFLRKPQVGTYQLQMEQSAQSGVSYPQPYRLTEKRTMAEREMELDDATGEIPIGLSTIAQPHKRRRLLGQEIVEDLGHFIQMNKSGTQLTALGFDLQPPSGSSEKTTEITTPPKTTAATSEFLTQPLTTPRRRLLTHDDSRGGLATAASELHSILKTSNTPERTERAHSARRELHSALDESKNLRFKLPATEIVEEDEEAVLQETPEKLKHDGIAADNSGDRVVTTTTVIDETDKNISKTKIIHGVDEVTQEDIEMSEDERVDELLIEVRHEIPSAASPTSVSHKVARAVSEESNTSQSSSISGEEEDEDEDYYSPVSSRNNSLLENVRSPLASTTATSASSAYESRTSKIFRFSGPQPRKPLARLSAERSQSRTPEKQLPDRKKEKEGNQPPTQREMEKQPSSGYVSVTSSRISTAVPTTTARHAKPSKPTFQIKSVMSLASSDFAPYSSSSKISATPSNFNLEQAKVHEAPRGKLSECSTMVGSFSVEESVLPISDEIDKVEKETSNYTQLKTATSEFTRPTPAQHLLANTTLGMSSYEFTLAEVKSQSTMQTTCAEVDGANPKEAVLKVMDTVEVIDIDDEKVEATHHAANSNEQQQSENRATYDSDLYTDELVITLQQTADAHADYREDSNDVVALYENQRAAKEKLKNQAAVDESDSDVIVLSSSASSPQAHGANELYDSESESDDDEYGEEEEEDDNDGDDDDDEALDDDEEYAHDYIKESVQNSSNSSSLEVDEGNNSSDSDKSSEMTGDADMLEDVGEETEAAKKPKANTASITDTRGDSSDSSLLSKNSALVESEFEIVVEEAASNYVDYEELEMRETVVFADSEDEQQSPDKNQEACSYLSKSVFMQNDAEITIEELEVSAYNSTSQEVYEELGGDVFYYGAETPSTSFDVPELHEAEIDINVEMAITSKQIFTQTLNFTEKPPEELLQSAEEPKLKEKVRTREGEGFNEKVESFATSSNIQAERDPSPTSISVAADKNRARKTGNDAPIVREHKGATEKTGKDELKGEEKINLCVGEIEHEQAEEEQITLHGAECNLIESEVMEVETDATSVAVESKSSVKAAAKVVKLETIEQENTATFSHAPLESPQSPKSNKFKETPESESEHTEKQRPPQNKSEPLTVAVEHTHFKRTRSSSNALLDEKENEKLVSTPTRTRYNHRGTSVPPPVDSPVNTAVDELITSRGNTRGISMPPQSTTQQAQDASVYTPETRARSRRSLRASSAQPSEEITSVLGTPGTRHSVRGASMPHDVDETGTSTPVRIARGTSVPPPAKIATRRRSNLLDSINESTPVVDSPSTRTRSRMRLNSAESELDSSIVSGSEQTSQTKRTRRTSISSSVSEQPTTPSSRRTRRSNVAAATDATNSEVDTPKTLRRTMRRQSTNVENLDATQTLDEGAHKTQESTKTSAAAAAEAALYSSARRLTRTQLAMMEKSAALSKNKPVEGLRSGASISPPTSKRVGKRRRSRSTVPDSDDVESISSHLSNVSGAPKRRVTRSSVKDKEENDDDLQSVASSMGSERVHTRRSRESKSSPNTTLSTIQEDEAEEVGPKKRSRPIKKRLAKAHGEPSP